MADGMKIVSDKWMLQSRQIVNWLIRRLARIPPIHGRNHAGDPARRRQRIRQIHTRRRANLTPLPSGTPYNKASNSGRSERNDYTYLRGMIGISDGENGETPIFLRAGRGRHPAEHLGAIVDTYANRSDGGLLSCAKFLYLTAATGRTDCAANTSPGTRPSTRASWTGTATRHSRED